MVLSRTDGGLNGFRDVEIHPSVRNAVDKVNVGTDIGADGSAASLSPGVGTVVGCGVRSGGPRLKNGSDGDRFVFYRTVFSEQAQFCTGDTCTRGLRHFAEWNPKKRRCLIT